MQEHTREIPKPLVEIGGEPIVGHVIRVYAAQGFGRFVLATGYKGAMIEDYARATRWPEGVTGGVRGHGHRDADGRADQAAGGPAGGGGDSARPTPTGSRTSIWRPC